MPFERYRHIFQQRAFRLFWSGFTFSVLGDAISRVALTWFVYESTRSAEALGWLLLWYTGPIVVGGLLAGSLLDRFDRRKVMIVDNIIRGCAMALIPLLYALDRLALWHIYLVAAVYGLLMMISLAGGPALLPALVSRAQLATANALETLSFTLGGVVGPFVAGLLIAWIGAPNVVLIDAVSYFAFAALLSRIDVAAALHAPSLVDPRRYHIGHVVQLLFKHRVLLATTCMFMAFNISGGLLAVWLPILSDQRLGGGAGLYGGLLGSLALGEVVSAVVVGSRAFRLSLGSLICLAQTLAGASLAIVLIGPGIWPVAVGLALYGAFSAPLTIWAQTLRMRIIPEPMRGRTFALLRMLMQSGHPAGGALGGALAPALGVPALIALSALVAGVPGALGYLVKTLRLAGRPDELLEDQIALVGQLPAGGEEA